MLQDQSYRKSLDINIIIFITFTQYVIENLEFSSNLGSHYYSIFGYASIPINLNFYASCHVLLGHNSQKIILRR